MYQVSLINCIRNEARNLRRFFENAKQIATEVVIVDTGSTDDSIVICKEYEKEFHRFKLIENPIGWHSSIVMENKKLAYENATCPWILDLDTDEELSNELIDEAKRFRQQDEFDLLWMHRLNFRRDGRHINDFMARFFRNGVYRFCLMGEVEEGKAYRTLSCHPDKIDWGRYKYSDSYMFHFGWYDISDEEFEEKKKHYKSYPPFV